MDTNALDSIMETAATLTNNKLQNVENKEMSGGAIIKKKLGRPKKTSKRSSKKTLKSKKASKSKKTSKKNSKSKKTSKKTSKKSSKSKKTQESKK